MVERDIGPYEPVSLRHGTGRLVDGDRVPVVLPRPQAPPDSRLRYTVLACATVIALAVILARVLR
ncbi:hypothetical protein GA0074695_0556 [Micromonospora viridifaciens]|uniref:Uncharacterized protein n=1 Tax=Micromonospora viridifaciens TaxID=1881 RepID=A0A1C4UJL0_MICVI|nr:hypothetical protein [Micromonospora viridifaciens]SCE71859.1 hypothetical protein GA0074695_0556 [Micromonospora viridifaciens]